MYLHGLNRIDGIVRNDDHFAFLVRECVVTMINIQFLQPIQNVILQPRDEVLQTVISVQLGTKYHAMFTLIAGSPLFSWRNANNETGLFRLVAIE